MTPAEVVEEVKKSKLVGRGGAGFPTGLKWELVSKDPNRPKYIIANAEEGEPGTFKDRPILERIPHRLLEGMIIAAYAVGADEGIIVCRGEFMEPARILREAIAEAEEGGLLGEGSWGRTLTSTSGSTAPPGPTSAVRRLLSSRPWRASRACRGSVPPSR